MSQGRGYSVTSGLIALTTTTQTALLFATVTAVQVVDAVAIRVSSPSGSSPTYPANSSVKFTLAKTTSGVGTTAATPGKTNNLDIAAQSSWFSVCSTPPTLGQIIWEHNVALAAGANWGEIFPPGLERRLGGAGATDQWALYAQLSATSTATDFEAGIDFFE